MVNRTSPPDARFSAPQVAQPARAAATRVAPAKTDVLATAVAGVLFVVALIHALWVMRIGWANGIYDAFGFRQTQTAMSTYYMLHGGPLFAYETPLFGYPWAIPIEFPLYQWIVAALVSLSGLPLEQAGRWVSATFFLASVVPAWLIVRGLRLTLPACIVCLTLLLASPLYVFWSRTFMIESTALFLSLCYLAAAVRWWRRPSIASLVVAAAFGTLAALVKMTTFAGFMAAAGLLLAAHVWRNRPWRMRTLWPYALAATAFAIVPYLICARWVAYCDALKEQNPLTIGFLNSAALQFWLFGDWRQRVTADTWLTVWHRHPDWIGHWLVLAIAAAALPFARGRRGMALAALGLALGVALVFTNLHYWHDYYQYSNVVFVLAAIGLILGGLVDAGGWRRVLGLLLFVAVTAVMLRAYAPRYLAQQVADQRPYDDVAMHVRAISGPDDVVAIWQGDWSPELAYAAQRRALMMIAYYDSRDPQPVMTRALTALRDHSYEVTALVFCNSRRAEAFVRPRLALFPGFSSVYVGDDCEVYGKGPRVRGAEGSSEQGPRARGIEGSSEQESQTR
jgi:hypothetical protein